MPISVPTNLLRLFSSSFLTPLLNLPCCVSASIILPDISVKTLSTLVELLKNGTSLQDDSSTSSVKDLAKLLGIRLGSISVNTEAGEQMPSNVPMGSGRFTRSSSSSLLLSAKQKASRPQLRKSVPSNAAANNVIRNIKTEANTDPSNDGIGVTKYHCEICKKQFSGTTPLAFHYCKHFYKDLQNLNFPDFIEDTRCTKCEKTFPDKKAMLCHIGVKHKFINTVLASNGYGKLPLGVAESSSATANIRIKTEKQTVVGVANNLRNKSRTPASKPKPQEKSDTPRSRQTRNSKDIKEVRWCEICNKELENVSQLANHMIGSHMLRFIKEKFAPLYNGKECTECGKNYTKNAVWQHLGSVHNKLDEVLVERGYRPLKTITTPKMKKVVVKREKPDEDPSADEDYQLPNLFESILPSSSEQVQEDQDSNPFDLSSMVTDPLMS